MSDTTKDGQKPSSPVFRLVKGDDPQSIKKQLGIATRTLPAAEDGAVASNAFETEDEFYQFYAGAAKDAGVLPPPFNLYQLESLVLENNTLLPCVEAMVTNIAGTGYDFDTVDENEETAEDDENIRRLREFFAQPWPGESFSTQYEKLCRDCERIGNGYLEAISTPSGELVMVRHIDGKMMRLVKLDDPVPVDVTVIRNGKEVTMKVMKRERRFVQLVNGVTLVYFKEFGSARDLNKHTGVWAPPGQRLPAKDRATEIIHFTTLPDAKSPYGVPRWINQIPSIMGSRKAEEFNNEFFDNGGIPPALVILQGGTLQNETRKAFTQNLQGSARKRQRIEVLEVEPSGGSMDHPTQARVTVERFGGERTTDSMFETYDDKCSVRVRRSFRIPPIFLGEAEDYSFASAYVSYTVTEAQVFRPERDEYDERITQTLIHRLGFKDYKITSKPLVIEDVNLKLDGINVAVTTGQVDMADVIYELNEATGLNLKLSDNPRPLNNVTHTVDAQGNIIPLPTPANDQQPAAVQTAEGMGTSLPTASEIEKSDGTNVQGLAIDMMTALRSRQLDQLVDGVAKVNLLDEVGRKAFYDAAAKLQFTQPDIAPELGDLAACTMQVMAKSAPARKASCGHTH